MIYIGRTGENNRDTPYAVREERAERYITPEIKEKAMKILSQRRASNPEAAGPPWVVDEELLPFYVREEDEEKAMKILTTLPVPVSEMYTREARKAEVYTGPSNTDYVSAEEMKKAMELHAKTEQDEFNKKPKLVNGANPQFLVVRYGWYAFAFLLEAGDVRGPELNAKAIQICEAMLTLESDGEYKTLKYHTSYAQQAQRAYRSAHPDTKKALKKFITTR